MRRFGTQGRVYPDRHYVVPRTEEIADFIARVKEGRYTVLFAPRQTGKTTFFRMALDALTTEDPTYFPIQLDFQVMRNGSPPIFYERLTQLIRWQIEYELQKRGKKPTEGLTQFLNDTQLSNHFSMLEFFKQLANLLNNRNVVLLIDEFDGIPQDVVSDFLYALRTIYLSDVLQCPHSVGIVGVKSISQLNYDRSVSPFNIQDEFRLPNFTLQQVQELLSQYTDEAGQEFAPEVIVSIHKQTAGQPVLVNRFAQILTEEMDIPKTETITPIHFSEAHMQLLRGRNTNIQHLTTNVRRDPRFESMLMKIMAREEGVDFNLDDDIISELATYGVIKEAADGRCEIVNPIYLYRIMRTFKPTFNGLENEYLSEEKDECFLDYLTPKGQIDMVSLLDNFRDFIARAGFRILQVPDKPQEYVGQHLLYAYLEQFIRSVGGNMYLEVQTGRGRMDMLLIHNQRKYIVETKIWEGSNRYAAGKKQLAAYMELEGTTEGYYVVFDHRENPEPKVETETVDGMTIRSYVIPVIQARPSSV
ncbi:MAG: AAA-like domain-containing protein [Candidatus Poribacteria bacterium]|nr:AAA-like domain-containing protein [Candidatus Poribacteria bacterium]